MTCWGGLEHERPFVRLAPVFLLRWRCEAAAGQGQTKARAERGCKVNRRNLLTAAAASVMLPGAARAEDGALHRTAFSHPIAEPDDLLERYSAWLDAERLALMRELYPDHDSREAARYVPSCVYSRPTILGRTPLPSSRALAVLEAAGVWTGPDTPEARCAVRDGQQPGREREGKSSPHPDADLLEACAAFDVLERAFIAVGGNQPAGSPEEAAADAEREGLRGAQWPLVGRMSELRAVTREGQAARARSLALWDGELLNQGRKDRDAGEELTAAIVRDLLAGRAVA
jgi:hypothetical protein